MSDLRAAEIRFRVDPADVPAEKAARRLHLTLEQFKEVLPNLRKRGFPAADPDTGMFDLEAIDVWRKSRHRPETALTAPLVPEQPAAREKSGMAERFVAAKERQTQRRRRDSGASCARSRDL
jgi:hypothetical protein